MRQVDLNEHVNESFVRGGSPADFAVERAPVWHRVGDRLVEWPERHVVRRADNAQPLAVVSDRYRLVTHTEVLTVVEEAIAGLDCGPVPRGVYVEAGGRQMRALFKFPGLAARLPQRALDAGYSDEICPMIQVRNAYDGTSRVAFLGGAFRFVCTNFAVGGGGAFAMGFMSVHAGDVVVKAAAGYMRQYLSEFDRVVALYAAWLDRSVPLQADASVVEECVPQQKYSRAIAELSGARARAGEVTVFDAYNAATQVITHQTRSATVAMGLLEKVNARWQKEWPGPQAALVEEGV